MLGQGAFSLVPYVSVKDNIEKDVSHCAHPSLLSSKQPRHWCSLLQGRKSIACSLLLSIVFWRHLFSRENRGLVESSNLRKINLPLVWPPSPVWEQMLRDQKKEWEEMSVQTSAALVKESYALLSRKSLWISGDGKLVERTVRKQREAR